MTRKLITAALLLGLTGCRSSRQVTIPEMGFSMKLPSGWRVDPKDRTRFYQTTRAEDNYGWVVEYQLEEGEDLAGFVDKTLRETEQFGTMYRKMAGFLGRFVGKEGLEREVPQTTIISQTPQKINSRDAVTVLSTTDGYNQLQVFIAGTNGNVIQVTFQTLAEKYPEPESALSEAIHSIQIQ